MAQRKRTIGMSGILATTDEVVKDISGLAVKFSSNAAKGRNCGAAELGCSADQVSNDRKSSSQMEIKFPCDDGTRMLIFLYQ